MIVNGAAYTATNGVVLQPEWIIPVDSMAIRNGYLVAVAGSIEHVGAELPTRFNPLPRIPLKNTAILPGWINSHCHLEFSDLASPIAPNGSFDGWLRRVIDQRAATASRSVDERLTQRRAAIRRGLRESWEHGVRWIVDNATAPWDPCWVAELQSEIRLGLNAFAASALTPDAIVSVQPCFELIDVQEERWHQTSTFAFEQIAAPTLSGIGACGLAPHAPYTASLRVTRRAAQWSDSHAGLVSMHLAETQEELQWLDHRAGTLGEWIAPKLDTDHLENVGAIDEHLRILASCWRSLVVHGNYLQGHQIEFLARHRDRMGIVYCPRTHSWFQHPVHPVISHPAQGATVLVGTDSRASNPDLNLWEEIRHVLRSDGGGKGPLWARRITTDAAQFLDLPHGIGRLRVGDASRLTAMRWDKHVAATGSPGSSETELWDWMVQHGRPYPLEIDSRIDLENAVHPTR